MKILLIGSGGREHAIVYKLKENKNIEKIYCAPGNGGTQKEDICENIELNTIDELLSFAKRENIGLTIVGPEELLVNGIVDKFKENGLKIFGPDKKSAKLEGSKSFAKDFMKKYNVKTAIYEVFTEKEKALRFLEQLKDFPIVIKADGLALGKGVIICENLEEAKKVIEDLMEVDIFNGAGKTVVIEEFLHGKEASILSVTDGDSIVPFISAKDHKKIFEGEKGENTGGMGVISPNPLVTDEIFKDFKENIMENTLEGMKKEGMKFCGVIFFGLMITKKGTYLLEYNMRMGDPETQSIVMVMNSDLIEVIDYTLNGKLKDVKLEWKNKSSVCITLASGGYPKEYAKGYEIKGIENVDGKVFIAGAKNQNGKLVTSGGRVLNLVVTGECLEEAREKAYKETKKISFKDMYYRKDIGLV